MARFSFPSPGSRGDDAWFRVGTVDVTTTILIVGLGVLSILVWAIDDLFSFRLAYISPFIRDGEVWRLVTWPLAMDNDSVFFSALTLFFLYFIGRELERIVGRNRFLGFVGLVVIVPAILSSFLDIAVAGMGYVSMPCFVGLALIYPQARSFFNIPLWVIAALFVAIQIIQMLGDGTPERLVFFLLGLGTGTMVLRSYGVLEDLAWLPKVPAPKRKKRRKLKAVPSSPSAATRPAGPKPGDGLRQAELDMLLDKIAADGIESLTREERRRLDEASRRLRDEKG